MAGPGPASDRSAASAMGSPGPGRRRRLRPGRSRRRPTSGFRRRLGRWWPLALVAGLMLWLSRGLWLPPLPPPQLILVLGGDVAREQEAARLARRLGLPLLVSGGSNPEYAAWEFRREGLHPGQVLLDYRAHDTLSNFTSVADDLKRSKVRSVLLVTSSDHMPRALLVGRIVAGSRGIGLTPVAVPCGHRCIPERKGKVWGDGLRAALWVVTGRDLKLWAAGRFAPLLEEAGRPAHPPAAGPGPAGH